MVTVSDIEPIGYLMTLSKQNPNANRSNYNALGRNAASPPNPYFRQPSTADAGIANFIDGTFNGYVKSPTTSANAIVYPPKSADIQYDDDVSIIAIHFLEHADSYRVDICSAGTITAVESVTFKYTDAQYSDNWGVKDPSESDEDFIERNIPLFVLDMTQTERNAVPELDPQEWGTYGCKWFDEWAYRKTQLEPGTYDIRITPTNIKDQFDGETSVIEGFVLSQLPSNVTIPSPAPPEPPEWLGAPGIIEAYPSNDYFKSAVIRYGPAEDQFEELVSQYNIYVTLDEPTDPEDWEDASFVLDPEHLYGNIAFDTDQNEDIDQVYTLSPGTSDTEWQPGKIICIVVKAQAQCLESDNSPLNVEWTRLSYDPDPPEWGGQGSPLGILHVAYGVTPIGVPGYMVYYPYAVDVDTGVSEYRIYYSTSTFADEDIDGQSPPDYVSTSDLIDADTVFSDIQLNKRYFFVEDTMTDHLYVLVKAFNGEGSEDPGNRSANEDLLDLKAAYDYVANSLFDRVTLSYMLDPSFVGGDMTMNASRGLLITNATTEASVPDTPLSTINIDGWFYNEEMGNTPGHPADRSAWDCIRIDDGYESELVVNEALKAAFPITNIVRDSPPSGIYPIEAVDDGSAIKALLFDPLGAYQVGLSVYSTPFAYEVDPEHPGLEELRYGAIGWSSIPSPGGTGQGKWHPKLYDMYDPDSPTAAPDYTDCSFAFAADSIAWHHIYEEESQQEPYHCPLVSRMDRFDFPDERTFQIREQKIGTLGSFTDTVQNDTLFTSPYPAQCFSLLGLRTDNALDVNGPALYLYSYGRSDLYNMTPAIDNTWFPENLRGDINIWSWRPIVNRCEYDNLVSLGGVGLPATLVLDESGNSVYVLYNKADYTGEGGSGIPGVLTCSRVPGTAPDGTTT
jgi:hypothetical protein